MNKEIFSKTLPGRLEKGGLFNLIWIGFFDVIRLVTGEGLVGRRAERGVDFIFCNHILIITKDDIKIRLRRFKRVGVF